MREADFAKADSLDRIGAKKIKAADTLYWDILAAYKKDDYAEADRLYQLTKEELKKEKEARPGMLENGLGWNLINSKDIDDAERVLTGPFDAKGNKQVIQQHAYLVGFYNAQRGRLREARKQFDLADGQGESGPADASLLMEPFLTAPANELQQMRDRILREDSTRAGTGPSAQLRAQFRLYWLAMLNCRLGNTAEALTQAQKIESLPAPAYWQPAMQALATNVRAFADVARGDVAQAIKRFDSIPIDVPLDLRGTPAMRVEETLWRGELLYRAGRYDEALAYFENPSQGNEEAWPFFTLRAAQIYDRKGDAKKATALYAEFLKYWKDPDPELRPLVEQARSALAALNRRNN